MVARDRPAVPAEDGYSRASPIRGAHGPVRAAWTSPRPIRSTACLEWAIAAIATSVATWSFLERPVWSFPARGPTRSPRRRSIAMWTSSSEGRNSKLSVYHLTQDRRERSLEFGQFVVGDHPDPVQRRGVGTGLGQVMGRQAPIEVDGAVEAPEAGVGIFSEAGHSDDYAVRTRSSASATRSTSMGLMPEWKGSASDRAETDSATGNWPSS